MYESDQKGAPQQLSHGAWPGLEPGRRQESMSNRGVSPVWWLNNEVILATEAVAIDHKSQATVTLRANEPGSMDLTRLLVSAIRTTVGDEQDPIQIDELARITSLELFNSDQRIRGLDHIEAPAAVFSPLRRQLSIDLGQIHLAVGDTLAITVEVGLTDPQSAAVTVAVPFQTDSGRQLHRQVDQVSEPHVALAASVVGSSSDHSLQLVFTLEEEGVVDLGSLQLAGTSRTAKNGQFQDLLAATLVESIRLPSSEDLIVGNLDTYGDSHLKSHALPANLFHHFERMGPWVQLGPLNVERGQQISIRLRRLTNGPDAGLAEAIFSAAMSFYPRTTLGAVEGRIQASELFGPWF